MEIRSLERKNLLMALVACALGACAGDEPRAPEPPRYIVTGVAIYVTNQTSRDKGIFLHAGAKEHRLGVVRGHSSRSFSVPSGEGDSTSDLHLEAREQRAAAVRSGVFRLSSGDRVNWMLDKDGRGLAVTR